MDRVVSLAVDRAVLGVSVRGRGGKIGGERAPGIMPHYLEPGARVSGRRLPGRCVTVELREPPATTEDAMSEDRMALVELTRSSEIAI
jgi:hypothetical protein